MIAMQTIARAASMWIALHPKIVRAGTDLGESEDGRLSSTEPRLEIGEEWLRVINEAEEYWILNRLAPHRAAAFRLGAS